MKKRVIALSVTAALGSFVGAANAQVPPATDLIFTPNGVGHIVIVPYFSTQGGNATLINLVNTDEVNGKAVKIRFRGASNSDDVFDFQLFMSPGDVWTANISRGADGKSRLTTVDNSCTLPSKAILNATPFITSRLNPDLSDADKALITDELIAILTELVNKRAAKSIKEYDLDRIVLDNGVVSRDEIMAILSLIKEKQVKVNSIYFR